MTTIAMNSCYIARVYFIVNNNNYFINNRFMIIDKNDVISLKAKSGDKT